MCPFQAPETGDYKFYISSDDASELRISTDDTKVNGRRIAGVRLHTKPHEWNKYEYISFYILYIRRVLLQFYTVQVRGPVIAIHIGAVLLQDDNETKF